MITNTSQMRTIINLKTGFANGNVALVQIFSSHLNYDLLT